MRGKEESSSSEPLFPRLNVNDREIGGPRAPPRNKMALYEQLSIPSQRFNSTGYVTSSQGCRPQKSTFTSSDVLARSSPHLSKRIHSQCLENTMLNTKTIQNGGSFKRRANNSDSIANGLDSNSQNQPISPNAKKSYQTNLDDDSDNDFMIPTTVQSRTSSFSIKTSSDLSPNHNGKQLKGTCTKNLTEKKHAKALDGARCFIDIDVIDKGDKSRVIKELFSEEDKINEDSVNENTELHENEDGVMNEVSDMTLSAMMICPDDVVGLIGPKHFWKARRAIVNQQRIFAIQVFELHRLIKVQKLIAASPDVVKVDIVLSPAPPKTTANITTPENFNKSNQPPTIQEVSRQTLHVNTLHTNEKNNVQDTPTNNTSNQLCFHPNLNQWLIPVMSPSEGLIYKPYPGPCPPTTNYIPPFYENPSNLPLDYMNQTCNIQYQQPAPMYFPSLYTLPIEQSSVQYNLSCNLSNPAREAVSSQFQKFHASKGSDIQGSRDQEQGRDSSCAKWVLEFADNDNQNRVIKVVPHKARLATESAARIFRSIQEERKQYGS